MSGRTLPLALLFFLCGSGSRVFADTVAPVAAGIDHIVTQYKGIDVHVLRIDRSHREYELRILAHQQSHNVFLTDSITHLAQTHVPTALAAINGYEWKNNNGAYGAAPDEVAVPLSSLVLNYDLQTDCFSASQQACPKRDISILALAPGGSDLLDLSTIDAAQYAQADGKYHYYAIGTDDQILRAGSCVPLPFTTPSPARSAIGYGPAVALAEFADVECRRSCHFDDNSSRNGICHCMSHP